MIEVLEKSGPATKMMFTGDVKPIFIILVDISGYTRFIKYHKVSLLHAEKIIAELMESILQQVEVPVIAHEILGDAITFYAIDEGLPGQADKIYFQLQNYFNAFRNREANLISGCKLCKCDACKQVGKLGLKAILHHGPAAFTHVHTRQKISGEDVILSHRLLKNSIPSKEYILITHAFFYMCQNLDAKEMIRHREHYQDVGNVDVFVKALDRDVLNIPHAGFIKQLKEFLPLEWYMVKRIFTPSKQTFRNLPE